MQRPAFTTADLRQFLKAWADETKKLRRHELSASSRSNIISVLHSFFAKAEEATRNERVRRWKDTKTPASEQALWRMVQRVCRRAGIRDLSPHQLRHGFANRFLRESGRDFIALQGLMGHSRPDTTQAYTDEVELDELREALGRAAEGRHAQASPELATLDGEPSSNLERLEWRRRESNPRPQPHRRSFYKHRLPFRFARRPGCSRPTDGLAILWCRAPGDWLSLGAEPVG